MPAAHKRSFAGPLNRIAWYSERRTRRPILPLRISAPPIITYRPTAAVFIREFRVVPRFAPALSLADWPCII